MQKKLVEGATDKEIDKIEKQLMRAFNELCKAEKILKGIGKTKNPFVTREEKNGEEDNG